MDFNDSPLQKLDLSHYGIKNQVYVKRDDLIHPIISGNKWRKLKYNLKYFNSIASCGLAAVSTSKFSIYPSFLSTSATADLNTVAATNTLALRVMGIQDDPDNSDFTVAGIPLIVRINNHFNAPTGSIAAGTVATTGV